MRLDPEIERRVARWAEAHHGHVRRVDALAMGHTRHTLDRARSTGVWIRVNDRVLRAAGAPLTPEGALYAAVFGGSEGSVASHLSAAALYGWGRHPSLPHITVPLGSGTRGVAAVHRSQLAAVDRTVVGVIPATTPARTLVDAAAVLEAQELVELVDVALISGRVRRASIDAAAQRASRRPGRKGAPLLKEALEIWDVGIERDSVAEARLFRLLVAWGLPTPVTLHIVRDGSGAPVCEVDVAWPEDRVALEYDSARFHGPRRWPLDELRCAAASALGWTIVPVDKSDLRPRRPRPTAVDPDGAARAPRIPPASCGRDARPGSDARPLSRSRPSGARRGGRPTPRR